MHLMRLFSALGILILLSACGTKGPVRPLEAPRPAAVTALELRQQGASLLLGWQLPTQNQDGSLLKRAPRVDIYRMTYDPDDACPECLDRSTLLVSIDPELPAPAQRIDNRFRYQDWEVQAGTGYQYKLVARTTRGELGQPIVLRLPYTTAIAAPENFQSIPLDSSVTLSWQAVNLGATEELLGYQIYRRLDGSSDAPYPLNPLPLEEVRYEDFGLANGTRYFYRVRALVQRAGQQIEGLATEELEVTPKAGF